ncbi:hypothetical protein U1Q18_008758 [Sarracenia purpurea var. burkii]
MYGEKIRGCAVGKEPGLWSLLPRYVRSRPRGDGGIGAAIMHRNDAISVGDGEEKVDLGVAAVWGDEEVDIMLHTADDWSVELHDSWLLA